MKDPGIYEEIKKYPNLKVGGVYSHMCKSDWPDEENPGEMEYPMWQYERNGNLFSTYQHIPAIRVFGADAIADSACHNSDPLWVQIGLA